MDSVNSAQERVRVAVIGAGHLGIANSVHMASQGFEVIGVDRDAKKIDRLNLGMVPIFEHGLEGLLAEQLADGRLTFTTAYQEAAEFADVYFMCVGTPQSHSPGGVDLTQLESCVEELVPLLRRPSLLVGRSTVPVGTAESLAERIAALARAGTQVELSWNPEFLREGHAVGDSIRPDRIVIGVTSSRAEGTLREIYASQIAEGVPIIVTDFRTAELTKLAANAFLSTKISFVNAMADVCSAAGADVRTLAVALGADRRIGSAGLRPGLGFGGGCLAKDLHAMLASATELGAGNSVSFLREIESINIRRRTAMVALALKVLGGSVVGKSICILGLSFKPGSDDVRDSPAIEVARVLHSMGAEIAAYDPVSVENARIALPEVAYFDLAVKAALDADAVLLLTDWPEFCALMPADLSGVVRRRIVLDGRYVLSPDVWRSAGWTYYALSDFLGPGPVPGTAL